MVRALKRTLILEQAVNSSSTLESQGWEGEGATVAIRSSPHTYLLQIPADATEHGKDILSGYHPWRRNAIVTAPLWGLRTTQPLSQGSLPEPSLLYFWF